MEIAAFSFFSSMPPERTWNEMLKKSPHSNTSSYQELMDSGWQHPSKRFYGFISFFDIAELLSSEKQIKASFTLSSQSQSTYTVRVRRHSDRKQLNFSVQIEVKLVCTAIRSYTQPT